MKRTFLILAFLLLTVSAAIAQGEDKSCAKNLRYVNKNQVDPSPLKLKSISGFSVDLRSVSVPGACVALYADSDHKLVASTIADSHGRFKFENIPDGRYRRVVTVNFDFLCPSNSIVILAAKTKSYRSRVVAHLRPAGIDSCSHADYK